MPHFGQSFYQVVRVAEHGAFFVEFYKDLPDDIIAPGAHE